MLFAILAPMANRFQDLLGGRAGFNLAKRPRAFRNVDATDNLVFGAVQDRLRKRYRSFSAVEIVIVHVRTIGRRIGWLAAVASGDGLVGVVDQLQAGLSVLPVSGKPRRIEKHDTALRLEFGDLLPGFGLGCGGY